MAAGWGCPLRGGSGTGNPAADGDGVGGAAGPGGGPRRFGSDARWRGAAGQRLPAPGSGPFPVILAAHPYGKDRLPKRRWWGWGINPQFRILRQPGQVEISSETSWEAPDPVWWLAHGYAVVNADIRGAGTSDGAGALMSDQEAEDVYDLIEWAGAAPWSSGGVGMAGVSDLAMAQFKAAALRPPSLKAICPWEGFTDAYRDMFNPGGSGGKGLLASLADRHQACDAGDRGHRRAAPGAPAA